MSRTNLLQEVGGCGGLTEWELDVVTKVFR